LAFISQPESYFFEEASFSGINGSIPSLERLVIISENVIIIRDSPELKNSHARKQNRHPGFGWR
jgi:hypothetical protein